MYGPQVTGASKASPGKPHRIQTRQKSFFGFGRGEILNFSTNHLRAGVPIASITAAIAV